MATAGRRPYLIASLAVHAAVLLAIFYVGPYRIQTATLDRHVKQAHTADMQKRVQELHKIKDLMAQSLREQGAPPKDGGAADDAAATPRQALEQARRLTDAIEQMERRAKAQELARLLGIPEQQALRQLPARPKDKPPLTAATNEQALAELQKYQQLARNALLQRERQIERQRDGAAVHQGSDAAARGVEAGTGASAATGMRGEGGSTRGRGIAGADLPTGPHIEIRRYITQTGIAIRNMPRGGAWDFAAPAHDVARGYGAYLPSPPADPARMRKLATHAIGPGAPFADRVYLNHWYVIGPFAGNGQASIDTVYPPEMTLDLDAEYPGLRGRTLKWEYATSPDYPTVPQDRAQDAVYYAYAEVVMAEEADLVLSIGADDDSKLWLNERLLWVSGDDAKAWYSSPGYIGLHQEIAQWNLSEGRRKVHFNKGRNQLLFKLYNGASLMFFSVVILADG